LILADEPTGALDIETGTAVMGLLDEVAEQSGAALITITHDVNIAALARRHYRLDAGVLSPVTDRTPPQKPRAKKATAGKAGAAA
jgi:putative ABC transport system ATP-binding protein